jgi:hypothetical protein
MTLHSNFENPEAKVHTPPVLIITPPFGCHQSPLMDINQLTNLRQAYEELEIRVQRALNTQVGDEDRLAVTQNEVLSYSQAVEQVCINMLD